MQWQELLNSPLGIAFITLLGLLVGSFLNVVIYRLPIMMDRAEKAYAREVLTNTADVDCADAHETNVDKAVDDIQATLAGEENKSRVADFPETAVTEGNANNAEAAVSEETSRFNLLYPPSACPHCKHSIRFWQNIPVLSYLWQRGRCVGCHARISIRYPLVELFTALLSFLVALQFHEPGAIACALLLTWGLVALVFIDAEHQLLPDVLTLPLMWLGIVAALFEWFVPLNMAVLGAMIGYLSLWSVYWLFKLATGREGMGYGDFKLLAALCAFQGPQAIPVILLVAAVCGLIYAAIVRLGRGKPFAFGPFLALAGWLTFMYGGVIGAWTGFWGLY